MNTKNKLYKKDFNKDENKHKIEIKVKLKNSNTSSLNHNNYTKSNNKEERDYSKYIFLNKNRSTKNSSQIKNEKLNTINKIT